MKDSRALIRTKDGQLTMMNAKELEAHERKLQVRPFENLCKQHQVRPAFDHLSKRTVLVRMH